VELGAHAVAPPPRDERQDDVHRDDLEVLIMRALAIVIVIVVGLVLAVALYSFSAAANTQAQANLAAQNGLGGQIGDAFSGLGVALKNI
jgi:hypothetical protein